METVTEEICTRKYFVAETSPVVEAHKVEMHSFASKFVQVVQAWANNLTTDSLFRSREDDHSETPDVFPFRNPHFVSSDGYSVIVKGLHCAAPCCFGWPSS